MPTVTERDAIYHARHMRQRLLETVDHLRADTGKVDEPGFHAMFETSIEVLLGLAKAFEDYERKNVPTWHG